jgi:hypothetical protein
MRSNRHPAAEIVVPDAIPRGTLINGRRDGEEDRRRAARARRLADEIRRRIEELVRLEGLGGDRARLLTSSAAPRRPSRRRHRKASAKAVAAWLAQGRYMAAKPNLQTPSVTEQCGRASSEA